MGMPGSNLLKVSDKQTLTINASCMKYLFSLFLFVVIATFAFSQNTGKTDSLKKVLKSAKSKAPVLNELARSYLTVSPHEALKYAGTAVKEAAQENDKTQLGEALRISSLAYQSLNEYERSIELADSAITVFKEIKNDAGLLRCQEIKASNYMLQGNYNKALNLMNIIARKAKQIDEKQIYAAILIQMGRIHMVRGNFTEALANFDKAMEIANEMNSRYFMGHIYHFKGLVYQNQQKFELAIENYLKALPIFEEENIVTQIPYLLVSLGSALEETKNYEEALRYYTDALKYYRNTNDRWGLNELYSYIGSAYLEMNNLDSASGYFNRSLNLSKEINDRSAECNALYKLGEILTYRHQYDKGLEYLNLALDLNSDMDNNYQLVNILYNMGNCYLLMGNINKALSKLNEGLILADSLNFKYEKMILNKEISKAYTELGLYKKALLHFQNYSELHDSIYQENAHKNLVEMEQKYQSEKQKSEISQLKLDNIEQEVTIRKQKSVRNIFILGFFFAALSGYLFYRSYVSKKKANKEKEVLLKEIHHRVKNNLQIISSLLNIQSEYVTDNKIVGAVQESQSRVQAMALIHQLLYQEENLTKINFSDYLKQLISNLASIYQDKTSKVNVAIDTPESWLNIETSIPLGLIVTELVSNAYKYAFNNSNEGEIQISLKPLSEGKYLLRISDNGKGLPGGTDILNSDSMGLKLANILTGQLNGRLTYEYNGGAVFNVEFLENRPPEK